MFLSDNLCQRKNCSRDEVSCITFILSPSLPALFVGYSENTNKNINITQYNTFSCIHTQPISDKNDNYWERSMFSHEHCPSLKLSFKSVFWSFQKVDQLPTIWVGGYLANAPYSFFQGPFPITKPVDTQKKQKHKQANKLFFRLRHHKKDLQLEKLPPLYDLASVGPYLLFFAP